VAAQDCRERLIDATLSLGTRCGYEATTIEQIAAAAGVTPAEFARHFVGKDAVVMSVVDALLQETCAALTNVEAAVAPEQALLVATSEVVTAIIDGRCVITRERMLAMSEIVTGDANLRKQASLARKRVLTQALADRLGVAEDNRRVRQAVTMWSAVAAGAYLGSGTLGAHYDPRQDDQLTERGLAELVASFTEVMGKPPRKRTDPAVNQRLSKD
jgi:AcrR family transcriptional regulator